MLLENSYATVISKIKNEIETSRLKIAEYALRDINKPIVPAYELTQAIPENLKGSLPTIEEIENELANNAN